MLKEYLLSQDSGTGRWGHGMPGVQICRFSLPEPEQEPLRSVPVCGAPLQFEVLFCLAVKPRVLGHPLEIAEDLVVLLIIQVLLSGGGVVEAKLNGGSGDLPPLRQLRSPLVPI